MSTTPVRKVPWDQTVHLLLVETQPDERLRRGGQMLQRPTALADHTDHLALRSDEPCTIASSSEARAAVKMKNAMSARSRFEAGAANNSLNAWSGMILGVGLELLTECLPWASGFRLTVIAVAASAYAPAA